MEHHVVESDLKQLTPSNVLAHRTEPRSRKTEMLVYYLIGRRVENTVCTIALPPKDSNRISIALVKQIDITVCSLHLN